MASRACTFALALACCACTSGLRPRAPEAPQARTTAVAEFPFELRNGLPTVDVAVAGQNLKLFIDVAGLHGIALTTAELSRVPVRFSGATQALRSPSGKLFHARQFIAPGVAIGAMKFGEVEGGESIFDEGMAAPPDRNGYLGLPFFRKYLLVMDYPARRARLYPTGDAQAMASECGPEQFSALVLKGVAQTVGTTEAGDLVFLWDSGATHNIIRPAAIPDVQAKSRKVDSGPPVVTLKTLKIAGREHGPADFRVIAFKTPGVDAYLGTGFLGSRKICLDVSREKGALAPPAPPPAAPAAAPAPAKAPAAPAKTQPPAPAPATAPRK